jgi:hypothetical protein
VTDTGSEATAGSVFSRFQKHTPLLSNLPLAIARRSLATCLLLALDSQSRRTTPNLSLRIHAASRLESPRSTKRAGSRFHPAGQSLAANVNQTVFREIPHRLFESGDLVVARRPQSTHQLNPGGLLEQERVRCFMVFHGPKQLRKAVRGPPTAPCRMRFQRDAVDAGRFNRVDGTIVGCQSECRATQTWQPIGDVASNGVDLRSNSSQLILL